MTAMSGSMAGLIAARLSHQRLARPVRHGADDIVAWFGAMQAQDFAGAKWAIGLRGTKLTDASVQRAFDEGRLLRTHVMRPTWHFVAPADIRWMLALTAPRVKRAMASYDRKLELDDRLYARTNAVLTRALQDGGFRTRRELSEALGRAGVAATGQRLGHIMLRAELDAVVCSGPKRGTQFTYALLDERVAPARPRARDEALAELARRYFQSHGPASLHDFAWWSGLAASDARAAIDAIRADLEETTVGDRQLWRLPTATRPAGVVPILLLPIYDEYLIAHKHRAEVVHAAAKNRVNIISVESYANWLIVDGRYAGVWRRTVSRGRVTVSVRPFVTLSRTHRRALGNIVERYGAFLGLPAILDA